MLFGILGPVEVSDGDGAIIIGGRQPRSLLAALLCQPNRALPLDSLLEAVWGPSPPRTAHKNLQVYVHKLRRVLGRERLEHHPHGYAITVADGELDASRFERLLQLGRAAIDSGELGRARGLYAQALSCWRGQALADVGDTPLLHLQIHRLTEMRYTTLEKRCELDIRAGQSAAALEDLTTLAAQQPLRERTRMLQMVALHETGRRAEALEVYLRLRRQLVDELGVEPGEQLAQLQAVILRGESTTELLASETQQAVQLAAPPVPRQLPHALHDFTGRGTELGWLSDQAGPVVIEGMAGVGKTALAVQWAHQAAPSFPDGQLFANLNGYGRGEAADPAAVLQRFLYALGVPADQIPASPAAASDLYRSLLAGRRVLVVLDNAASAEQVRPLLPGSAGCLAVITSRSRLAGLAAREGAARLNVDVLPTENAVGLLASMTGRPRAQAEPAALEELARLCGYLPLAVRIAGATLADRPTRTVSEHAQAMAGPGRLRQLALEDDPNSCVGSAFEQSFSSLGELEKRLFRLLGLVPFPGLDHGAAAALAGLDAAQAETAMAALTRAHLLGEIRPGRHRMHDLLHVYARELADAAYTDTEKRDAVQRLLDYFLARLHSSEQLLDPHRTGSLVQAPAGPEQAGLPSSHDDALRWLAGERAALIALIEHAYREGLDIYCWQMTWMTANFLQLQGHWQDWAKVAALGVAAAHRHGDPAGEAACYRSLARAHSWMGEHEAAQENLRAALSLYERLGDLAGQAQAHLNVNIVFDAQHRYADALRHAQLALELFQRNGQQMAAAQALNAVGWAHAHLGNYPLALAQCQQAVALQQQLGDRSGEADTWDSLGYIHLCGGEPGPAAESYHRALRLFRELGDRYNEATTLVRLGDISAGAQRFGAACQSWAEALTIMTELGHPEGQEVRQRLAGVRPFGPNPFGGTS